MSRTTLTRLARLDLTDLLLRDGAPHLAAHLHQKGAKTKAAGAKGAGKGEKGKGKGKDKGKKGKDKGKDKGGKGPAAQSE